MLNCILFLRTSCTAASVDFKIKIYSSFVLKHVRSADIQHQEWKMSTHTQPVWLVVAVGGSVGGSDFFFAFQWFSAVMSIFHLGVCVFVCCFIAETREAADSEWPAGSRVIAGWGGGQRSKVRGLVGVGWVDVRKRNRAATRKKQKKKEEVSFSRTFDYCNNNDWKSSRSNSESRDQIDLWTSL